MKRFFGLILALIIGFLSISSCGKPDGTVDNSEDWKAWQGLKELMEKAGFSTNGIKVTHSAASEWIYMPDIRSDACVWCGTKNGEPWVGLGHTTIYEEQPQTYFDYEFVWKGHKPAEKETFDLGYGQTVEGTYSGSGVGFVLIDKDFYYLQVFDRYVADNNEFSKGGTMLFVDHGTISAQINDFSFGETNKVNVGYDHDFLAGNACYSKTGQKLYDIVNNSMQHIYGQYRDNGWVTTPISHKDFIIMEHTIQTYYNMETSNHEFVHRVSVVFCDMSAEDDFLRVDVQFPADDKDRLDSFELKTVSGNVYTYELNFTKFSGEKITKILKADNGKRTAEFE